MVFVLTAISSIALAALCLRRLELSPALGTHAVFALAVMCVQAAVGVVIGSFSLTAALVIVVVLQGIGVVLFAFTRTGRSRQAAAIPRDLVGNISFAAIVVVLVATFISALAPVTSWDAGVAHFALPSAYAHGDRIALLPGNNYSAYPQLMHTLFALGFRANEIVGIDAHEWSVPLLSWFFAMLACTVAYGIGARLQSHTTGCIAAAILATAPIFADQAATPSIDLAYVATVLGIFYSLIAWRQDKRLVWLAIAGLLAGSGCGIRHTAFVVNALVAVYLVCTARGALVRSIGTFVGVAAVAVLPWLVRTWLVSGNPVYPFFASRFSTLPDVDVAALSAHSSIQGVGIGRLLAFPWALTMNPAQYGGWATSPGALWLVLGVIGVVVGGHYARAAGVFGAVGLTVIFFFQRFARYAFPFIAPLMVVAALPYEKLPRLRWAIAGALVIGYALGIAPALASTATKVRVAVGLQDRGKYLSERVERYPVMRWCADNLQGDAVVLSLDPRAYYFERRVHMNLEALKAIVKLSPEGQYAWLRDQGIGYVFYPDAYVKESPAFRETGVQAMVEAWRADTQHFRLEKEFELLNPRSGKTERVELYVFDAN